VWKEGKEAIDIYYAHENSIKLVFLDIEMPGWDGLKTAKELRRINGELPIVVCTSHDSQQNLIAFTQIGITEFLAKPLKKNELQFYVKKHLLAQE